MQEFNFFGFLIFNSKQRTRHNTKQDKKQSKEIGTERLPFSIASKSPAMAPENSWRLVDGRVFEDDDDGDDEYFPDNGARKQLDGYVLVNPKRKVMM